MCMFTYTTVVVSFLGMIQRLVCLATNFLLLLIVHESESWDHIISHMTKSDHLMVGCVTLCS